MNKNDYGYRPNKNKLLIMFDKDLSTYDGIEPILYNRASITDINVPIGTKSSMKTDLYSYLTYSKESLALGDKDFTIDFWMLPMGRYNGLSSVEIGGATGIGIQTNSIWVGGNSGGVGSTKVSFKGAWAHYAFVRRDENHYFFVDGKLIDQVKGGVVNITSKTLVINARYTYPYFVGGNYIGGEAYYKAVRLCDFARWTADFTPPIPILVKSLCLCLYQKDNAVYGIRPVQ